MIVLRYNCNSVTVLYYYISVKNIPDGNSCELSWGGEGNTGDHVDNANLKSKIYLKKKIPKIGPRFI